MIRLKLSELMAKRKIFKISKLAEMTKKYHPEGIDRRTLTRIRSGDVDRIYMSTLDILCQVFNCPLSDLIEFKSPHSKEK